MIFMRGTPTHPMCLDSKRFMDVLSKYPYFMREVQYFDLTKDPEIGKNLIQYSNFGEIPQLYVDHKLIGGLEIIDALDSTG